MFTDIDVGLFPKDCEVVEIPLHNLHVYLIQKNGTSTLRFEAQKQGWVIHKNQDIGSFKSIDIYIRDPVSRYLSGINTFIQHMVNQDANLDRYTCEIFATRFLFLNRHYLPQWHWILNLVRYLPEDCVLRLHKFEDIKHLSKFNSRSGIIPMSESDEKRILSMSSKLDLWLLLDKILLGLVGQTFTWTELLDVYKRHPSHPLEEITKTYHSFENVLR